MVNQKRVKGHRELTDAETAYMNRVIALGEQMEKLINELREVPGADLRWISIGATDLQTGLMALNRAILKPNRF